MFSCSAHNFFWIDLPLYIMKICHYFVYVEIYFEKQISLVFCTTLKSQLFYMYFVQRLKSHQLYYTPRERNSGGYIEITLSVRLSVRLSVCPSVCADSCPAHNFFMV